MPTFKPCEQDVHAMLQKLIHAREIYQPIIDSKCKIDLVFARASLDDEGRPRDIPLKCRGIRCYGVCRKIGPKERAKGFGDAEIVLDGDWWDSVSEKEALAVLEHELMHVQVLTNQDGSPKTDDSGRPKIKMRAHSYEVGHFIEIAEWHGKHSIEYKQMHAIFDKGGQFLLPLAFDAARALASGKEAA
jgi:hypothetical protein